MKYKGRKFASNMLLILGVLCFATMIVAAVLVTSNTINFDDTNVATGNITLTKTGDTTNVLVGNTATYSFDANVANALTGAIVNVSIAKTAIALTDITSAKISYNGTSAVDLSLNDNGAILYANHTVGAQGVDSAVTVIITIVYATAGTYDVQAKMSGNA